MTTKARIGTCKRCGTTVMRPHAIRTSCPVCAVDGPLLAERKAYLALHPTGYFPLPLIELRPINGKLGTKDCGAECMESTGPRCVCKCGGAQHGTAHRR